MRGAGSVNRFIFYFCIFRPPPRIPRGKVIVKDKLILHAAENERQFGFSDGLIVTDDFFGQIRTG